MDNRLSQFATRDTIRRSLVLVMVFTSMFYIINQPKGIRFYAVREFTRSIGNERPPPCVIVDGYWNKTPEWSDFPNGTDLEFFNSSSEHFAIAPASGRLGNLMFTYASVYGIAKMKGMSVAIEPTNPLLKYFKLDAIAVNKKCIGDVKVITEARASDFDENVLNFDSNQSVMIAHFLQSWRYFANVEDEIRAQFQFSDEVSSAADDFISNVRQLRGKELGNASVTVIGIHYRRGDKASADNINFGYVLASMEYIQRAMGYFKLFYENIMFVVASDSLDYIRNHLKGENLLFYNGGSIIQDFALMSKCDHLITTVGTFSWWAGFLNKGTVLYYKNPAKKGSRFRKTYGKDYSNHFYPKWLGIL